ncbi:MAG: hypothetical protein GW867_02400 [Armatimonadetes bacterium]|nr:hypothetical protein [Armatimonadota bacterium]
MMTATLPFRYVLNCMDNWRRKAASHPSLTRKHWAALAPRRRKRLRRRAAIAPQQPVSPAQEHAQG